MEIIKNSLTESTTTRIRVATFNIGDFSTASDSSGDGIQNGNGTEKTKAEYIEVFKKVGAELWALQEDSPCFNGTTKESAFDAIYKHIHPTYERNFTGTYNGKAFLTDIELYDVEPVKYEKITTSYSSEPVGYGHPWYLTGKIKVDGKEIAIATLHFDWACKERRAHQISEVVEYAKKHEYCIILGDFNPDDCIGIHRKGPNGEDIHHTKLSSDSTHEVDNKLLTDAGFVPANCGEFGKFVTIMSKGAPRGTSPCDNIFVSPNIKITNAFPVYEPWMNDHAILVADLEIGGGR